MEVNSAESIKRSKPLEVGHTKIGEKTGNYKGQLVKFSVYYGNYILPSIDGEFIHIKPESYNELLNKFLHSQQGKEYIYPSKEEIEDATRLVISRESQTLLDKEPVKEESNNPQEIIEENCSQSSDEQDSSNLKSSLKILVGIVIIQFVCIAGLIVILVIK